MKRSDVFSTIVKLATARFAAPYSPEAVRDLLMTSYDAISQLPQDADGHYMVVGVPIGKFVEEHNIGAGELLPYFHEWLSDFTHHKVVALYSGDLTECLFFFENLSDATIFKLKWRG